MNQLSKRRIAIGSLFFLAGLSFASWASRIPDVQLKFSFSEAQLGTLLLGLPIGAMVALPLAGWAVHRFGSKIVVILSAVGYSVFLPLIGFSDSLLVLIPVVVVFGMLGNTMNISLNTQALALEDNYGRSILASLHGLWSLAGFTGAGIGAMMIYFDLLPRFHFLIISCITLLIILLTHSFLVQDKRSGGGSGMVFKMPEGLLLRIGGIAFLGMLSEGCMFDWSGVYFKKVVEIEARFVALGYVAFMGAMAGGRFVIDKLINRFGRILIIRLSGFFIFSGLMISVIFPYPLPATLGFLVVGLGVAAIVPTSYSIAGRSKDYPPSVALAIISTISFFGFLIGPPMIGFIAELLSLKVSFVLVAFAGLGITLLSSIKMDVFESLKRVTKDSAV
ncbi:MFS transporter [Mongoliibacter ruber]|uniref:Putative MFS family arabinose efflux permease n=1 Tax=Mongoliibacter ruber TaxID=1750599 RepID=A0A2T0WLJ3_9BACT|nr:MFS transporter [Mongoliibacter ruber]PRY87566.1 putative MFS family arabinose efflux permease [Mongoliibacter ruber]